MDKKELKNKTTSVTSKMLDGWLRRYISVKNVCSFDVETTGLDAKTSEIFSYCIGHSDGTSEVYRLDGSEKDRRVGWKRLKEFFADPSIGKIAHNFKFDAHNNRNIGLANKGRWDDTMLMSFVYKNTNRHGLKELAKFYDKWYWGYAKITHSLFHKNQPTFRLPIP